MTSVATAQLELVLTGARVPGADVAAVTAAVAADLDQLGARPPASDPDNARAHDRLRAGATLLLDWLAGRTSLPDDPLDWPCSACMVTPGEPCIIPGPRTKWTPPGPRYHLGRGPHGRWASHVDRAVAVWHDLAAPEPANAKVMNETRRVCAAGRHQRRSFEGPGDRTWCRCGRVSYPCRPAS